MKSGATWDAGAVAPANWVQAIPRARRLTATDLQDAVYRGVADFRAHAGIGMFFGLIYLLAGAGVTGGLYLLGHSYLIFPALSAFLLCGPFIALGFYEISRRRAAGLPVETKSVLLAFLRHGGSQIMLMGLALVSGIVLWMQMAFVLYALFFGGAPLSLPQLVETVLTTPMGMAFAVIGTLVGGILAIFAFATSLFALPMMLDRDVDVVTAVLASLRAVGEQPLVASAWAVTVAVTGTAAVATGIGLLFVLPVLGHATWHLYARAFQE